MQELSASDVLAVDIVGIDILVGIRQIALDIINSIFRRGIDAWAEL